MRPSSLAVIGLGAIGGSLAWQARLAGVPRVVGYSPEPAEGFRRSRRRRSPSWPTHPPRRPGRRAGGARGAAPATLDLIAGLAPALDADALLTDVCSVKAPVVKQAVACRLGDRFAGGHPLAGTHETGFLSARPDRLRGCVVYVCESGTSAAIGPPDRSPVSGSVP